MLRIVVIALLIVAVVLVIFALFHARRVLRFLDLLNLDPDVYLSKIESEEKVRTVVSHLRKEVALRATRGLFLLSKEINDTPEIDELRMRLKATLIPDETDEYTLDLFTIHGPSNIDSSDLSGRVNVRWRAFMEDWNDLVSLSGTCLPVLLPKHTENQKL